MMFYNKVLLVEDYIKNLRTEINRRIRLRPRYNRGIYKGYSPNSLRVDLEQEGLGCGASSGRSRCRFRRSS